VNAKERSGPRILIIRLSAIGDVLVTTPVSRALREAFPDAYLTWIVEDKARDVLAANPYLDRVVVWKRPAGVKILRSAPELRQQLQPEHFDWAIDCQGLLRSAAIARLSGAKEIIGNEGAKEHADRLYHHRLPRSLVEPSSRQRCLDLLIPLGVQSSDRRMVVEFTPEEIQAGREVLASEGVDPEEPYVCLVPSTTWAQKHWFEDRWSQLADAVRGRWGWKPVLLGGPADVAAAHRIRAGAKRGSAVTTGRTSLKSAAYILKGARAAITVDTGLMHFSAAVQTPTVCLCGASWWPGFQDYERFSLLREPLDCSPCLRHPTCNGRYDCMAALTVERVLATAEDLLAKQAR
jgi:heptosyltransferase-1